MNEDCLPPSETIQDDVQCALREDIGDGDLTAQLLSTNSTSVVEVICREQAVISGSPWFDEVFHQLDDTVLAEWLVEDGKEAEPDSVVCRVWGNTRVLLTGERTALNFLQTLSGTATRSATYAKAVEGTGVRILDTRKTLPGMRMGQKYAVTCGGCHNHRVGLFDMVLLKENHIIAAGSITQALERAKQFTPEGIEIEIEVEDLDGLKEALDAGAQRVLLDNFSIDQLKEAVAINESRARLEASGGITLETIRSVAETGVNDISIGDLTKDVKAIDFSMRFVEEAP